MNVSWVLVLENIFTLCSYVSLGPDSVSKLGPFSFDHRVYRSIFTPYIHVYTKDVSNIFISLLQDHCLFTLWPLLQIFPLLRSTLYFRFTESQKRKWQLYKSNLEMHNERT